MNISATNSGCNGGPNNFAFYCGHFLSVSPGQTIVCNVNSGITYPQGFSIWIDWNQDNTFQHPGEQVAATSNIPAAAQWTVLSFVIPNNVANGVYRLRVRCAFNVPGTSISPCGSFSHGETEDYNLFVGPIPANSGPVSSTLAVSPSSIVCSGNNLTLHATTNYSSGISYTWTGPGNYTSTAQNPVLANLQATASGFYTLVASNSLCPTTKVIEIKVVDYPQFVVNPIAPTICQNGGVFVNTQLLPGSSPIFYTFNWTPSATGGTILGQNAPSASLIPLPLPVTQSLGVAHYSLTVSPTAIYCPVTKVVTVTIANPFSPTLSVSPPLCNNSQPFQFSANPPGGIWSGNPAVTSNGLLAPNLAAIGTSTVKYTAFIGNCSVSKTDSFSVSRFHTPALTSSLSLVCVQDPVYNLMNLVQDTVTGKWSGPNVSQNRFFSPTTMGSGTYALTYSTWSTPIASVCPAFTVFNVAVYKPSVPVIPVIPARCSNSASVQLSASPAGGIWSGSGAVSNVGALTPSLASIGTNSLTYTAGQGTCVASSTSTFHVTQFNSAKLTSTVPELCVTSNPVNLLSIVQNTFGSWSGPNVTNNAFNPNGLSTNSYTLSYNIHSTPIVGLCDDQSKLVIRVLNPPPPSLTGAGPFCSRDGTVQLHATPDVGAWIPSQYITTKGVFTASLAPIGTTMLKYVVGTPTCNVSEKISITVEAFVPATLIVKELPDLCNNSAPVNLQPYSINQTGSWYGPGLNAITFDPAKTGAGRFSLTYTTASSPSGLCPDASTLAVNVFSLAAPIINELGPYCSTHPPVRLQVSPLGGFFDGVNTEALTLDGLFVPSSANPGLNVFTYSVHSGPCVAYAQGTINIERFVSAALHSGDGLTFCKSDPVFNLNSLAVNPGYSWSGTGVTPDGRFDPAKAGVGTNHIQYRTHSTPNGQLCPDASDLQISVDDIPRAKPVTSLYKACAPLAAEFKLDGAGDGIAEWSFNDGSDHATGLSVLKEFRTPGSYSIVVNYTLGACKTSSALPHPVEVLETPRAAFDFSSEELLISDPTVDLINRSTVAGNNRYVWTIQGQGPTNEVNPRISFPAAGLYSVTLEATSYAGCKDEVTRYIEVLNDFQVYVPNSFSPNYDALNDQFLPVFSPYGLDSKSYNMEIFDRWGHRVFGTNDVLIGWNGSYENRGETLKEGSYLYVIHFRDLEGKAYVKTGHIILFSGH